MERTVTVQFYQQSEIQQSVSYPVMTITCNQIFTRFQRSYYFFRQFHPFVLFTSITCIYHFDAVDINNSIIVVREFKIYIFSCQIFLNISYPAYPDKFFTPLGFSCMFILHGSEGSFAFFPGFIIESGILPSVSRLLSGILSCPATLFGCLYQRT